MRATSTLRSVSTTTPPDAAPASAARLRLAILLGLALVTAIAFVVYLALALAWRDRPFLGVTLNHNLVINASPPGATWTGLDAGLKTGDQIISINGHTLADATGYAGRSRAYQSILGDMQTGDTITVEFLRATGATIAPGIDCQPQAGVMRCAVAYTVQQMPAVDFLALFVVPYISGLIVLGLAVMLLRLRSGDPVAFPVTAACFLMAFYIGGFFDAGSTHLLLPVWMSAGILLGGLLVTLGLIFPTPLPALRVQPWLKAVPLALAALLALFVVVTYGSDAPQTTGAAVLAGLAIWAALLFFHQRPLASHVVARDQTNIVLVGILLALAPSVMWLVGRLLMLALGEAPISFSIEATMPFFVVPVISLTYAVLQTRHLNTDHIISQAVTYSLLLLALMIGYFLLVLGASLLATNAIDPDNPLIIALVIFVVTMVFIPLRTRLEQRINTIFFRTRQNYQNRLEQFSQKLASMAGASVMIDEFRALLNDTVQPLNTIIFLRDQRGGQYIAYGDPEPETDIVFSPQSSVVQMLSQPDTTIYLPPGAPWPPELHADRVRLGIIRVMVIAGMAGGDQLNGFVCVGPPRSERNTYHFEELRFINSLVGQLAIAVERAQVISSLERRVRELDVLSQVSQAVNFTIEFDDLLELISAQTARLIQSPYFYIVLYDAAAEQLYYAFFLEDDERATDKEDQRWPLGRDLFSEIVQTGKPLLVDDYARTMARNGYPIVHESPLTRAWMGVPLLAGARTLGVLAVGETNPDRSYSAEQLRIFGDIGSLAATSLEKARLFTETNARARQLAALNDISRQLVASEGDVERLLKLITTSAVDILNAETGSLLLTTDEGSADSLEYRAAVNAGEELIGTKLADPADPVVQVARSGQPVIVNGQTSPDGYPGRPDDTGIVAHSMLGAPLIVQDRVIGVLEVVNRKDGAVYTQDDVELLTTLAGQAAIALENARLFQQTDLQLTRRVQELEALERIDVEMNRTLDLYNVAEITVRWAIANSNATAGLLGVISEDRQQMHIIHRQGYDERANGDSALSDIWSLDQGIVRRVMRTRRPDLQPYVTMDPDYAPSLPDALSQITVPMFSGEGINALLILETDREPRLNLLDLDWAQRLAEHAAIAIANAQLYAELTRANESKSEFVGFAAHELKNPLSSVKGYADLLRSGMTGDITNQQKDFLSIIRSNADRMQVIIEDLRDIARIDAQQLKVVAVPVNFREVVEETLRPFQQQISDKGQTLINNVADDLPLVLGDKVRLIQVMTNFVSNAYKYSPADATITVDARIMEDTRRDERGSHTETLLHVSIADTGIGLSEDDLRQLFRVRYFRSDNQQAQEQPGTGLGMMITQHLVQQHGGRLWVESELGAGSTFHFTLPLAPQDQPTP